MLPKRCCGVGLDSKTTRAHSSRRAVDQEVDLVLAEQRFRVLAPRQRPGSLHRFCRHQEEAHVLDHVLPYFRKVLRSLFMGLEVFEEPIDQCFDNAWWQRCAADRRGAAALRLGALALLRDGTQLAPSVRRDAASDLPVRLVPARRRPGHRPAPRPSAGSGRSPPGCPVAGIRLPWRAPPGRRNAPPADAAPN